MRFTKWPWVNKLLSDFLISEDNLDMTDDEKLVIVNRLYERSAVGDLTPAKPC